MLTEPSRPRSATYLDPWWFSDAAVAPETAAYNRELTAMMAGQPPVWTVPPAVTRAGGIVPLPVTLSDMAVERTVPGPAGPLTLRTFVPPTVSGVYLHIHGGGWTIGSVREQDPRLEALARNANLAVVSVDYRLAPEHPYPAGPDDCEAAAVWLVAHARAEYGTARLLIGGESAGAHLAAVTLLRLRDRHGYRGFAGANLCYGVYDVAGTPSVKRSPDSDLVICRSAMEWFADQYVPPARRAEPDVSPFYADLAGLPRALFSVGTADPLLDDTLFMHARWVAAGSPAELQLLPGATHSFVRFPYPAARDALARITAFLRDA